MSWRWLHCQVEEIFASCLEEDVAHDTVAEVHDLGEVLVRLEGTEHLRLGLLAEVLLMELRHFAQMVLKLIRLDLDDVVAAQDHVLDQLGNLLVELDHVWLLVDEFLDLTPLRELGVRDLPLSATSESADEAAE